MKQDTVHAQKAMGSRPASAPSSKRAGSRGGASSGAVASKGSVEIYTADEAGHDFDARFAEAVSLSASKGN